MVEYNLLCKCYAKGRLLRNMVELSISITYAHLLYFFYYNHFVWILIHSHVRSLSASLKVLLGGYMLEDYDNNWVGDVINNALYYDPCCSM